MTVSYHLPALQGLCGNYRNNAFIPEETRYGAKYCSDFWFPNPPLALALSPV